ncbi:uncharacterized protein LOC136071233 [Quercus suber]|uniref:uncharacterized protein LOC136071233 n=1 Tax=Quercus suber TaxID=58331 RepID=UPI0032E00802
MYKLNFNAAVFANRETSGVGAVIRNEKGEVMAALSAKGASVVDSEEAEVLACQKALESAVDASFSNLIIEGDNVTVMQTMSSTQPNLSQLGLVYENIHCIAAGLRYVSFSCVRRSANLVVHSLTRYASQIDNEIVWMEESQPPAFEALYLNSSFF